MCIYIYIYLYACLDCLPPAGQPCLRLYREAAKIFAGQSQLRFSLRPKLHALDELLLAALTERYNPRFYQNCVEEDFLGLLKPLALKAVAATSRVFESAMLKRYLLRWEVISSDSD